MYVNRKGAFITEYTEENERAFKVLNASISIECSVIPDYKTTYKEVEYSKDRDLIENIENLIEEWRDRAV